MLALRKLDQIVAFLFVLFPVKVNTITRNEGLTVGKPSLFELEANCSASR